jgi:hypothetical protein
MTDRVMVVGSCVHCALRVGVTDDDTASALQLLRRILLAHTIDDHAIARGHGDVCRDLLVLRDPGALHG